VLSRAGRVTFALGPYDRRAPLVIDPQIAWGDYTDATGGNDQVGGVAVAPNGNLVVAGTDDAQGSADGNILGQVYVTELEPDGTGVFRSYLADDSYAAGVVVGPKGNIYVAGNTGSGSFPTTANAPIPVQPTADFLGLPSGFFSGAENGFLSKLDPRGQGLLYSTYVGGDGNIMEVGTTFEGEGLLLHKVAGIRLPWTIDPGDSSIEGIAIDPATSRIYLAGWTYSIAFPTTNNGLEPDAPRDFMDLPVQSGFLSVLDTNISGLDSFRYGTYLGTECAGQASAVAVDAGGDAIVTGSTTADGGTASQVLCGGASFPVSPTAALTSGGGWLTAIQNPDRAVTNGVIYSTYLNGPGLAVASGLNGTAEVAWEDGSSLTLSQVRADGSQVSDLEAFGDGTLAADEAGSAPVVSMARADVFTDAGLLLAYNASSSVVDLARYDLTHPTFTVLGTLGSTGAGTTLVRSVTGDSENLYVGVSTFNGSLSSVGAPYGGDGDGYVAQTAYNPPPKVSAAMLPALSEGVPSRPLTLATFTDASSVPLQAEATVVWGDAGTNPASATVTLTSGNNGTITASHTYADEGTYTGQACLTPLGDGVPICVPLEATVGNVTPSVGASNLTVTTGTPSAVFTGGPGGSVQVTLNQVASIDDSTTNDTYTGTIDWGDGAGPLPATVIQGTRQFAPVSHVYTSGGTKSVTVCAADDEGVKGCAQPFQLTVPVADLSVAATAPTSQSVCTPATYQFTVTNDSPDTSAPNVTVTDQVSDAQHMAFTSAFITGASGSATDTFATELPSGGVTSLGSQVAVSGDTAVVGGQHTAPQVYEFDSHTLQWQYVTTL
ncbi:MAG TPA: hypothetical protein VNF73_03020, partial [Candidatus Saccharimonadales bacterium]|nr:hypothetical protein [Candidatus Saccharimonadales bacterium]